jgi:hypothetical protein
VAILAALDKNSIQGALLTIVKDTADINAFADAQPSLGSTVLDGSSEVALATDVRAFA